MVHVTLKGCPCVLFIRVCVFFRYSIGVKIMEWVRVVIFYVGVTR